MMRHHLSLNAMQMTYVLKYMRKLCIPSEKMQSVLDELEYFGFADADVKTDYTMGYPMETSLGAINTHCTKCQHLSLDILAEFCFSWVKHKMSPLTHFTCSFDMRAGDIDEDHYERLYTRHFMLQMSRKITQSTAGLRRTCVFYNDEDQGSWTLFLFCGTPFLRCGWYLGSANLRRHVDNVPKSLRCQLHEDQTYWLSLFGPVRG
ncbi:hypothetical protein IV203_034389 [Nitzschia inconspicua]|uniref:Uncharacterized protein n=1 Tax=Nitzschia inconspicua TaxID=303405 RepID=A0A9K3M5P5_9STRA|nr:hypothetical protein IV203_034389 [Nitzschia inconspicua]